MSVETKSSPIWLGITFVPTTLALLGFTLFSISAGHSQGAIDLSHVIAVFFAELNLVACAAALLAHHKIHPKTRLNNHIRKWNIGLLLGSFALGLWLFLG